MSKRILALVLAGVMILSTGCGLTSKTKNRLFGDEWVTKQMEQAIYSGNSEYLAQLIQENKENNDLLNDMLETSLGRTLSSKSRSLMIKQLLDAGADPNTESSTGESVLITYVYNYKECREAIASLLTSDKIDLNKKDELGHDALFYAMSVGNECEYYSYAIVQMLIEAGVKPTKEYFQKDSSYLGPYGHLQNSPYSTKYLLNILLENDEESGLPLSLEYALLGDSDNAVMEIEKSDEDLDDDQKKLFAWYIMYWGTPEQFEKVSDMWELDFSKYSLLPSVAQTNNVDMLSYLISKYNIDITEEDYQPLKSIEYAAMMGNIDVCRFLVENNCAMQVGGTPWNSTLSASMMNGDIEMFKLLYDYTIKIEGEITDDDMSNGIREVFSNRMYPELFIDSDKEIIDFLFEQGFTLSGLDIEFLNYDSYKYITEKGREVKDSDLYAAMKAQDFEMFRFAIDKGADVNYKDEKGTTIIESAAYYGTDYVEFLINKNAMMPNDILAHTAYSSVKTVQLLMDNGANTDIEITQIPASTKGDYKSGDYDLKDYWEAYGRDDLVELL